MATPEPTTTLTQEPPSVLVLEGPWWTEASRRALNDAPPSDFTTAWSSGAAAAVAEIAALQPLGDGPALVVLGDDPAQGVDGIAALTRLRAQDPALGFVVIVAAENGSWPQRFAALASDGRVLFVKAPLEGLELRSALRALTGAWAQRRSLRQAAPGDRAQELEEENAHLRVELAEKSRIEVELRLAQKLEAMGRIAAGVAHELNTPIQFTSDSAHFLRDAFGDLRTLLALQAALARAVETQAPTGDPLTELREAEATLELPFLLEHVPKAIDRCMEGLERLSAIVRSMKEFAHPDQYEMQPSDLNRAIRNTLTVSRNEYKYCADLDIALEELPMVTCHIGEVNQAVLNLVVNASHAVQDMLKGRDGKGRIVVRSFREGDSAVITVGDSGTGIPEGVRDKIFEPFFTTKEVGRGTGQGLSQVRAVIVEKHRGSVDFTTELGVGTTFVLRLPIAGAPAHRALAEEPVTS